MISKDQLKAITDFAMKRYGEYDDTHNHEHAKKTVRLAIFIADKEGANQKICEIGALLHQYHPENSKLVDDFLTEIGVPENLTKQIVHCIECVEFDTIEKAETIEAKVVFDADKLQIVGPYGLLREVVYRTRTKNIGFMEAFEESKELQREVYQALQTGTAQSLADQIRDFTENLYEHVDEWRNLTFIGIPNK